MTEFTRDIKPVDYSAPKIPNATGGSKAADAINLIGAGIDIYGDMKNKNRKAQADKTVSSLLDYEVELYKNGLGKRAVNLKLDERIRETTPDQSQQTFLRGTLAQSRGGFLRKEIVQDFQNEEMQRVNRLDTDFQDVIGRYADLDKKVNRNPDYTVSEEEKLKITQEGIDRDAASYEVSLKAQKAQVQLQGRKDEALRGVDNASQAVEGVVSQVLNPLLTEYISTINNMGLQSSDTAMMVEDQVARFGNFIGLTKQNVESQFSSFTAGTSDTDAITLLEKRKDALLGVLDTMSSNLSSGDLTQLKKNAGNLSLIQKNLQLDSLSSFKLLSGVVLNFPAMGNHLIEKIITDRPDIRAKLEQDLSSGLEQMITGDGAVLKSTQEILDYFNNPDTKKYGPEVLRSSYDIAKNMLSDKEAIAELTEEERGRIGNGLIGILYEASTTDEPSDIREATKLLNSKNFDVFFNQLSDGQKKTVGSFITNFNQDVLTDVSDGMFKKLGMTNANTADITFDADAGKFVLGKMKEDELKGGNFGFNALKKGAIQKDIDEANNSLEIIREKAEYNTSGLDAKTSVDTLIQNYLPKEIKVNGKLTPYVAPEVDTQEQQEVVLSNQDTVRAFDERIKQLEELLVRSASNKS